MSNAGALKALTNQIISAATDAMSEAESKTFLDALSNLSDAYSGGDPEVYQRTYQYKNSPRTTGVDQKCNVIEAKVYLDQNYNYDTGTYSTPRVFTEAESGGSGIKLTPGSWGKTENKIPETMASAFGKRFR